MHSFLMYVHTYNVLYCTYVTTVKVQTFLPLAAQCMYLTGPGNTSHICTSDSSKILIFSYLSQLLWCVCKEIPQEISMYCMSIHYLPIKSYTTGSYVVEFVSFPTGFSTYVHRKYYELHVTGVVGGGFSLLVESLDQSRKLQ